MISGVGDGRAERFTATRHHTTQPIDAAPRTPRQPPRVDRTHARSRARDALDLQHQSVRPQRRVCGARRAHSRRDGFKGAAEERPFVGAIRQDARVQHRQSAGRRAAAHLLPAAGPLRHRLPALLEQPGVETLFQADAIARAKEYLAAIPNGVGAYSESQGFGIVRDQVAEFITNRDGGIPANKADIFLTDGASKGVGYCLSLLLRGKSDGVLVPIPQYPLYSATLALAESHARL